MRVARRDRVGMTTLEVVVWLVLLLVLMVVFLPPVFLERGMMERAQLTQALSNMKQLHLATEQMALDRGTTGDTNLGWPGDTGGTFTNWARQLGDGYLTTNDLNALLSAAGRRNPRDVMPGGNTNGVLVYAVGSNSAGSAVFLSSANFTNTPAGGVAPGAEAVPFGDHGFVVFCKGGDGVILKARQAGKTNLVGAFAPLLR